VHVDKILGDEDHEKKWSVDGVAPSEEGVMNGFMTYEIDDSCRVVYRNTHPRKT